MKNNQNKNRDFKNTDIFYNENYNTSNLYKDYEPDEDIENTNDQEIQKEKEYNNDNDKSNNLVLNSSFENTNKIRKIIFFSFCIFAILLLIIIFYIYQNKKYDFNLKQQEVLINTGNRYQIELIPKNEKYFDYLNYKYIIEDSSIATVDKYGNIETLKDGETYLKIRYKYSLSYKKMKIKVENIEINKIDIVDSDSNIITNKEIRVSESIKVDTVINEQKEIKTDIKYKSNDEEIAYADNYGNVTGVKVGETSIVAQTDDGVNKEVKIIVNDKENKEDNQIEITSISLNINETTLDVNNTLNLVVNFTPSEAISKNVTFTSSNSNVATVTNSGLVTAIKSGTVVITAKTTNGKTATCIILVKDNSEVSVERIDEIGEDDNTNNETTELNIDFKNGEEKKLQDYLKKLNISLSKISKYTLSDKEIFSITNDYKIKALNNGTATLLLILNDGRNIIVNLNSSIENSNNLLNNKTYADALKAVMDAYEQHGNYFEYDTYRAGYSTPEEATKNITKYVVCSSTANSLYQNAFNIRLASNGTSGIMKYAKNMKKDNNVIMYYNENEVKKDCKIGNCGLQNVFVNIYNDSNMSSMDGLKNLTTANRTALYNAFKKHILNGKDLQTGDMIDYLWNVMDLAFNSTGVKGHVFTIYDVIKDSNGNVIDAWVVGNGAEDQASGGNLNTKKGVDVVETSQYQKNKLSNWIYTNCLNNMKYINALNQKNVTSKTNKKIIKSISVIRLIPDLTTRKINESVTLKGFLNNKMQEDSISSNDTFKVLSRTKTRLMYEGIYVDKTSNVGYRYVNKTRTVTYTLLIKNNSNNSYESIPIKDTIENGIISEICYNGTQECISNYNQNSFSNKITIEKGKERKIVYTVQITGQEKSILKSIGSVGNIATPEISNIIVSTRTFNNNVLSVDNLRNRFLDTNTCRNMTDYKYINCLYYNEELINSDTILMSPSSTSKRILTTKNSVIKTGSDIYKYITITPFTINSQQVKYSSTFGYLNEYSSLEKNEMKDTGIIAPLGNNLTSGDVIIVQTNKTTQKFYVNFAVNNKRVIVGINSKRLEAYTSNGTFKCIDSNNQLATNCDIKDVVNANIKLAETYKNWKKISNANTDKTFLRNLAAKYSYGIFSPQFNPIY